jgi:hypothetical protein
VRRLVNGSDRAVASHPPQNLGNELGHAAYLRAGDGLLAGTTRS